MMFTENQPMSGLLSGGSNATNPPLAVRMVPIADLRYDQARNHSQAEVALMAQAIKAAGGILHPVIIHGLTELTKGVLRVQGALQAGLSEVPAISCPAEMPPDVVLAMSSLVRHRGTVLEEAEHLATISGWNARRRATAGGGEVTASTGPDDASAEIISAFVQMMIVARGLTDRAARMYQRIGRELSPEVRHELRGTKTANSLVELTSLVKVPEGQRLEAVRAVASKQSPSIRAWHAVQAATSGAVTKKRSVTARTERVSLEIKKLLDDGGQEEIRRIHEILRALYLEAGRRLDTLSGPTTSTKNAPGLFVTPPTGETAFTPGEATAAATPTNNIFAVSRRATEPAPMHVAQAQTGSATPALPQMPCEIWDGAPRIPMSPPTNPGLPMSPRTNPPTLMTVASNLQGLNTAPSRASVFPSSPGGLITTRSSSPSLSFKQPPSPQMQAAPSVPLNGPSRPLFPPGPGFMVNGPAAPPTTHVGNPRGNAVALGTARGPQPPNLPRTTGNP